MSTYRVPQLALRMVKEKTITVSIDTIMNELDAGNVAFKLIGDLPIEHMIAIMVDGLMKITGTAVISIGGMHGAAVTVRDVLRPVMTHQAHGFFLAHNHPSGDPTPSPEDLDFTRRIGIAGQTVGVPLLDHIVVSRNGHKSIFNVLERML